MTKKKYIIYFGLTLFILLSCNNTNSLNKELKEMSNETNRDCPIVIDKHTTLTSTVVIDNSFMYIYKVKYGVLEEYGISKSDWKKLQTTNITNIYCTDPDMYWYRLRNVPVTWSYGYEDGTHLGSITVHTDDC